MGREQKIPFSLTHTKVHLSIYSFYFTHKKYAFKMIFPLKRETKR